MIYAQDSLFIDKFAKFKNYFFVLIVFSVIFVFFKNFAASSLLIAAVIAVSLIASAFQLKYFGLELVTFVVVLFGINYGPLAGVFFGLLLEIAHVILIKRITRTYNIWVIPIFGLTGFLAGVLTSMNILVIGIILTILSHVIHVIMSSVFLGTPNAKYYIYAVPNIILNMLLFANFGAQILNLI